LRHLNLKKNGSGKKELETEKDDHNGRFSYEIVDQLAVPLGGRAAEEVIIGHDEVTVGASSNCAADGDPLWYV